MIIDSDMTRVQALDGLVIPDDILRMQELIAVEYASFDSELHRGQMVIHREVVEQICAIFAELRVLQFPIAKVVPISQYNWDDERSMADNNTSALNYRLIYGTKKLSNHSYGRAIDINPAINPYVAVDGRVFPEGATYDIVRPGTLLADGHVVALFRRYGWSWGGDWLDRKDWQHFEKPLALNTATA